MPSSTHSWPENHWHWPVELSHYHSVKRGGLIYTGGQVALDKEAEALHTNLLIRSSAFNKPGPATSGIPVPYLVYKSIVGN